MSGKNGTESIAGVGDAGKKRTVASKERIESLSVPEPLFYTFGHVVAAVLLPHPLGGMIRSGKSGDTAQPF